MTIYGVLNEHLEHMQYISVPLHVVNVVAKAHTQDPVWQKAHVEHKGACRASSAPMPWSFRDGRPVFSKSLEDPGPIPCHTGKRLM